MKYLSCWFFLASLVAAHASPLSVTAEPLLFTGETKTSATAQLLLVPQAAPTLESGDRSVTFEVGKDFTWEAGSRVLKLTEDSRIPFKTTAELHPPANSPNAYNGHRSSEAWMFFGPGRVMHDLQCAAAYASQDDWRQPATPAAPKEQLGALRTELASKQPFKLVMLGDSISTGADASAISKVAPNQPGYPDLVAQGLETRFGGKVTLVNLSKGGMDSNWGLTQVAKVIEQQPDLFLLAFGMNDASGKRTPEELARITKEIYTAVRTAVPACAVILIAPMTANSEWNRAEPTLYPQYATAFAKLTGPGIACADVTTVWAAVAERKRYLDLSGNGLNHPNDYGHRLYAEVVLSTVGTADQ